jgi:GH15 family glucan-1,4-alpha-glucosidase
VIGDMQTMALVGIDGTIDFWCLPQFDGPTVFGALLDGRRGGSFAVRPALDGARHTQLYLPDTNVLLTRFLSAEGVAEISDFMPVDGGDPPAPSRIVRRVKAVRGEIHFRLRCAPRFDYARAPHEARAVEGGRRS